MLFLGIQAILTLRFKDMSFPSVPSRKQEDRWGGEEKSYFSALPPPQGRGEAVTVSR